MHQRLQNDEIRRKAESLAEEGKTPLFFIKDKNILGMIAVADVIREDSPAAVKELQDMGIRVVMITGDNRRTAEAVGKQAGVDQVIAQVLPDGKEAAIRQLQKYGKVAMVGDGINDAPVLKRADVGIAMGAAGSDAAIEAADIVLMNDNIESLPTAVRISKKTHAIVMQNIVFAIGVKVLIMLLTAVGIGNMWIAVFGDVGVAVLAILNATRAMRIK